MKKIILCFFMEFTLFAIPGMAMEEERSHAHTLVLRLEDDFIPPHPWQSLPDDSLEFSESNKENNPASLFFTGDANCPFLYDHLGDLLDPKNKKMSQPLNSAQILAEHPLKRTRGRTFYVEGTSNGFDNILDREAFILDACRARPAGEKKK